jgi:hypothetical protein
MAGGALRVTYPGTHTAGAPKPRTDRGLPGEHVDSGPSQVVHDALLESLRDNGFATLQEFQLTPKRTRAVETSGASGTLAMDVDVAGDEDAVVLLEQDGLYSWHLPTSSQDAVRTRRLPGEPRTARFEIPLGAAESDAAAGAGTTRGLLGGLVSGVVRVVVLKFVAPLLVGQAISFLERIIQPGLVHVASPDPSSWSRVDRLDQLPLPQDRPARVLLLVHGTFSSTLGAFGTLSVTDAGRAFLDRAITAYDAVVGFDHPTLSVDPLGNATDLLQRVQPAPQPVTFDIVCHSRGGLAARSFAEHVLPPSGTPLAVERAVFVGATNGGTNLANPERWADLIDLTTNLVAASARLLSLLPGAAPVVAVVSVVNGLIQGLGAFVKYLVSYSVGVEGVPGLAAMVPEGAFVTELNRTQPGQPVPGTQWFVVSSDFHVLLFDGGHQPQEFPRELAVRLAEGLLDQVFQGPNDLVVDVESMSEIDVVAGDFVAEELAFGSNEAVYHNNYFNQDRVTAAMHGWLLDPLGGPAAGAARELEVEMGALSESAEPATRSAPPMVESAANGAPAGPESVPVPPAEAPATEPVTAHLRAELPAYPIVKKPATLTVRLSRKKLEAAAAVAGGATTFLALPDRRLSVQVVPKTNVKIQGPDTDSFELPAGGGSSSVEFTIVPQHVGMVGLTVLVRDGAVPLAMLSLTVEAVGKAPADGASSTAVADATVSRDDDGPDLDSVLWLEILETERDGDTVFQYTVRSPAQGLLERYESAPLKDREGYVVELFRDIARLWADHGDSPAFLQGLQDRGAQLFDELFPPELRRLLWQKRDQLDQMLLVADEPYLPWELVHLKPEGGARRQTPRFLGQLGLVRWQFAGFPRATLRARKGKVWSLCPEYLDPAYTLAETADEAAYLTAKLGASPAQGTEAKVRSLLRKGGFDVLHFAGHGVADPTDVAAARVLLAGRKSKGKVTPQYLSATTVAQNANLRDADGNGPLVVLNACQTGRGGHQLSSLGGFAKAFLDAGAAAYISSLWSVGDAPARAFVEKLYDGLLAGLTIGEAAIAAREAARQSGDATWLAYVVYARPDARLVTT